MFGARDHPGEMISPDAVLMFVGGQSEAAPQVIGDEGGGGFAGGEKAFVHGEHDQPSKIKHARFEHSHDLKSRQRFAAERDRDRFGEPFEQSRVRIDRHFDARRSDKVSHPVDRREIMVNEFLLQLVHTGGFIFVVGISLDALGGEYAVQLLKYGDEVG